MEQGLAMLCHVTPVLSRNDSIGGVLGAAIIGLRLQTFNCMAVGWGGQFEQDLGPPLARLQATHRQS